MDVTTTHPVSFVALSLFAALQGLADAKPSAASPRPTPAVRAEEAPPGPPPGDGRGPPAPPPEAFTACEGKKVDDACSVTHHDRTVTGTCAAPPPHVSDTRLACRPSGPPPARASGPALAAHR